MMVVVKKARRQGNGPGVEMSAQICRSCSSMASQTCHNGLLAAPEKKRMSTYLAY